MNDVLWWIVCAYLVLGVALLIVNALPHVQENAVLRFANAVGLPLPQSLGERLRRRMLIDRRSDLVGGMLGIVVSAIIVEARGSATASLLDTFILIAGVFTGSALAKSITALLASSGPSADGVRYARSSAVELSDYVPFLDRLLVRGFPAVAVGFYAASGIWLNQAGEVTERLINAVPLALITAGTLLVFEIAGRRIVATGNRVGSPEELVWEDAIRSHQIRDLTSAPVIVSSYAILWSIPVASGAENPEFLQSSLVPAVVFGALVFAAVALTAKPERYVLRRLWPELATGTDNAPPAEAAP